MSGRDPRDIIIKPVVSEKAYALQEGGVYTFVVADDANKIEIRQAVEAIWSVRVASVNTLNRKGKRRRNRRTGAWHARPDRKRAVVSLVGDDSIDIFGD